MCGVIESAILGKKSITSQFDVIIQCYHVNISGNFLQTVLNCVLPVLNIVFMDETCVFFSFNSNKSQTFFRLHRNRNSANFFCEIRFDKIQFVL